MFLTAAAAADDQVRQLAAQQPATQQQLARLIGLQKAGLYGEQLLAALLDHSVAAAGGAGAGGAAGLRPPKRGKKA